MTNVPVNGSARKIDRNSAISLGLAITLAIGVVALLQRMPTTADMKLIFVESVKPLEDRLRAVELELSVIKDRLDRQEHKVGG